MTGAARPALPSPEVLEIEAEFRELLGDHDGRALDMPALRPHSNTEARGR
jgi:hypothetical protein